MKFKRSTLVLLATTLGLGVLALLLIQRPEAPEVPSLTIPGYATEDQLREERNRGLLEGPLEIPHPIDQIVIERPGERLRMVRTGSGAASEWRLTEPVEAVAVKYLVERVAELFKTETASVFTTRVAEGDLPLYDLERDRRIGLEVRAGAGLHHGLDLWIGRTERSEEDAEERDTWVMKKADPTVVYRIVGKDLRAPLEEPLDNLRDRKVLSLAPDDLAEVAVTAPDGARVAVTAVRPEPVDPDEGGEAAEASVEWSLTEPPGLSGDGQVGALPRSLANLRAQRFVPTAEAPADALGARPWVIEARLRGGDTLTLRLADSDDEEVWGQVEGRDELIVVNRHTARNLRKTVEDLKDKRVFAADEGDITGLELTGPAGRIALARRGDGWAFTTPALPHPADATSILGAIAKLQAVRWARADELVDARVALTEPDLSGAIVVGQRRIPVLFSAPIEGGEHDSKRWGVTGDPATGEPFIVTDFAARRFAAEVNALRSKKLFPGQSREQIAEVVVALPGGEPLTLARPASGGEVTLTEVPDGKLPRAHAIRTLTSTLAALQVKDFADDRRPGDVGLTPGEATRVTVTFDDGLTATLSLAGVDGEGDAWGTIDAGPLAGQVFTVNQFQAKNLQRRPDDLVE